MSELKASVIISIYKNIDALRVILEALSKQTEGQFEIIISEDGNDPNVRQFMNSQSKKHKYLLHLTQKDQGFRKNTALNRAILHSRSDYLIFIDGDCVPHRMFIENHIRNATPGTVCTGRRAELGPILSKIIITRPFVLTLLTNLFFYLLLAPFAYFDHAKNYEAGLYSEFLQLFIKNKPRGIVGCNFSCYKKNIISINGFNEDYLFPGDGEDSDIEWRLSRHGIQIKNIKFLVPVYHLFHPYKFQPSIKNSMILKKSIRLDEVVCKNGLKKLGNLQNVKCVIK